MKKTIQHLKKTILTAILLLFAMSVTAQKTEVFLQVGHSERLRNFELSTDGSLLLTGANGGTAKIWDVSNGRVIRTFRPENSISSVVFHVDGKQVVMGHFDGTISFWSMKNGQKNESYRIHSDQINDIKFSPDGKQILTGSSDKTAKLWEEATGRIINIYKGHSSWINSVAFSPDGQLVLTGSADRTAKLWRASTGQQVFQLTEQYSVNDVGFSSKNEWLLVSSGGNVKILSSATQKTIRIFSDANKGDFSPDGNKLITVDTGSAQLWDINTGENIGSFKYDGQMSAVHFSSDGKKILTANYGTKVVKLWDVISFKELQSFSGYSKPVYSVKIHAENNFIISGNHSKYVQKWNAASGRKLEAFGNDWLQLVSEVAFSPDGNKLISTSFKSAKLWNIRTGEEMQSFIGHKDRINSVAFSPSGQLIVTGSEDKTVKVWDFNTGKEIQTFVGHTDGVNSVAFSPNGKYVLSGSKDNSAKLWDIDNGLLVKTFLNNHDWDWVNSVAFSPDRSRVLTGSQQGLVRLWDINSGQLIKTFDYKSWIDDVDFSPDGQYILSGGRNNTAVLWDVSTGNKTQTFIGHSDDVYSVTFSPDGQRVLTGSKDGTVRIWDKSSGEELVQMVSSGNQWVTITPEGYFDASDNGAELLNVRIGTRVYSMDNFFDTYYRPDIVRAKLAGKEITDLAENDIRTGATLPPEVEIVSPASSGKVSSEQLTVELKVTDQGGGVDEVRLYHNGKLVQTTGRGLKLKTGKTYSYQVQLMVGENVLEATAYNDDRIESNRDRLQVTYTGAAATADLFVLSIGINAYKNGSLNLNYGRPDAEAFAEAVKQKGQDIFSSINTHALYDGQATRENIISTLEQIIGQAGPEDAFLLFYAGHGVMSEAEGEKQADFYMALHETIRLYGDNAGLQQTGISASELTDLTRRIAARKQMIVLDACQSGGAVETFAMRGAAEQKAILQLARSAGLVVMASTGTEQYATEFDALGHGVFTYALLNGLEGKADGGSQDGKITVKELEAFINDRVPQLTEEHRGQAQYPNSYARGQDFPIGVVK